MFVNEFNYKSLKMTFKNILFVGSFLVNYWFNTICTGNNYIHVSNNCQYKLI